MPDRTHRETSSGAPVLVATLNSNASQDVLMNLMGMQIFTDATGGMRRRTEPSDAPKSRPPSPAKSQNQPGEGNPTADAPLTRIRGNADQVGRKRSRSERNRGRGAWGARERRIPLPPGMPRQSRRKAVGRPPNLGATWLFLFGVSALTGSFRAGAGSVLELSGFSVILCQSPLTP
jgi:hypothetical protein